MAVGRGPEGVGVAKGTVQGRTLEVFLNVMRYINPLFTYLLTFARAKITIEL